MVSLAAIVAVNIAASHAIGIAARWEPANDHRHTDRIGLERRT